MITNARFTHYGRMKLMMQQYNAMPPDKPTETEIKQTYYAVDMLLFVSGLMQPHTTSPRRCGTLGGSDTT